MCQLKILQLLAKYCNECVPTCVRLLVSKVTRPYFMKFSIRITCGSSSVHIRHQCNTLRTSVLWLTSCLPIMGQISRVTFRGVCSKSVTRVQGGFSVAANRPMACAESESPGAAPAAKS